jgi:hypothetical protein
MILCVLAGIIRNHTARAPMSRPIAILKTVDPAVVSLKAGCAAFADASSLAASAVFLSLSLDDQIEKRGSNDVDVPVCSSISFRNLRVVVLVLSMRIAFFSCFLAFSYSPCLIYNRDRRW